VRSVLTGLKVKREHRDWIAKIKISGQET